MRSYAHIDERARHFALDHAAKISWTRSSGERQIWFFV